MTALYAALTAALDDWDDYEHEGEAGKRRVAADRRVLARHTPHETQTGPECGWEGYEWPCPDIVDLAARYDVEVSS